MARHTSHRQNPCINKLPGELLEKILSFVVEEYPETSQVHLCKVNRYFNYIATPLIYRDPKPLESGACGLDNLIKKITLLHRTFIENPARTRNCHILTIDIKYIPTENYDQIIPRFGPLMHDLVSILTELTDFRIYTCNKPDYKEVWSIIQTVLDNARLLKSLDINRYSWDLSMRDIFHHLLTTTTTTTTCHTLKELYLHGITHPTESSEYEPILLPLSSCRIGSITKLHLIEYEGDIDTINQLILWPQTLQHFKLYGFENKDDQTNLSMLGDALMVHKETLITINISFLSPIADNYQQLEAKMIDFSQFPNLRELTLSRWSFCGNTLVFDTNVVRKILSANLEKFTWDFDVEEQFGQYSSHFRSQEADWILALGNLAADLHLPLHSIYINFYPDLVEVGSNTIYPWDLLDNVAQHLATRNIQLEYYKPVIDRTTWLMLRRHNQYQLQTEHDEVTFYKTLEIDTNAFILYGLIIHQRGGM